MFIPPSQWLTTVFIIEWLTTRCQDLFFWYNNYIKGKEVPTMPAGVHKNPQYGLRTSKELLDKMKYIAAYNGHPLNKEFEELIIQHVAAWEASHWPITQEDLNK
jgi:hypothetical protein